MDIEVEGCQRSSPLPICYLVLQSLQAEEIIIHRLIKSVEDSLHD